MVKQTGEKKKLEATTRDYSINLHKRLHKIAFKKRAPRALREITQFARTNMLTDVIYYRFLSLFMLASSSIKLKTMKRMNFMMSIQFR